MKHILKAYSSTKIGAVLQNIWQIKKSELKLVILNSLVLFCIVFNYTILRNLKDTFINTAVHSGPEVTAFIKSWLVLPMSIVGFLIITKISNKISRENIFYLCNLAFLIFFAVFCFYLYPNKEVLHPSASLIGYLQDNYPALRWVFPIYGIWSYSLFYIMAELWGSIMMSLLFWEYANAITKTEDAKRFYPIFILLANTGLVAAGVFVSNVVGQQHMHADLAFYDLSWYNSLRIITSVIIAMGILCMLFYKLSNITVLKNNNTSYSENPIASHGSKQKLKLSFWQSIRCIFSSYYLGLIAVLVICYGAAINIVELVWKKQLAFYYTLPSQYCNFMSKFSIYTGIATIIVIIATKKFLRSNSWLKGAICTPIVLALTSIIFFGLLFYKGHLGYTGTVVGLGLSAIITWVGALQNIFTKSCKYALFDPSKEMAYIPLNQELRMKGKAAVDVVGERLGKATGSYMQQFLLIITGSSILDLTGVLFGLLLLIVFVWISCVFKLNQLYANLIGNVSSTCTRTNKKVSKNLVLT